MTLNYYVLLVFAPILTLAGILGFLIPPKRSLTSGAPAYNMFHIIFGLIGLALVVSFRSDRSQEASTRSLACHRRPTRGASS